MDFFNSLCMIDDVGIMNIRDGFPSVGVIIPTLISITMLIRLKWGMSHSTVILSRQELSIQQQWHKVIERILALVRALRN